MNAILTRRQFRNSITSKLTLLVASASGLVLLISCAAFVVNDVSMLRQSNVRELTAIAQVIASNSTAVLAFGHTDSADALLASLSEHPGITGARLFDSDGELFASYTAANVAAEPDVRLATPGPQGYSVGGDGSLQVVLPVFEHGERLGFVQLRASTAKFHGQIPRYGAIATSLLLVSLLIAIVLGTRLRGIVSDPLLRLATAVRQVKGDGDQSVRLDKPSNDEAGDLYEEFNALLVRIDFADAGLQQTHEELRNANAQLEERLRTRTDQLLQANLELQASENRVRQITESIRCSELASLNKVLEVVNEQRDDLAGFIDTDRRGRQLPKDLLNVGQALALERDSVLQQLDALTTGIEHLKDVVATQPSMAGVADGDSYSSA